MIHMFSWQRQARGSQNFGNNWGRGAGDFWAHRLFGTSDAVPDTIMAMDENSELSDDSGSLPFWQHLPVEFQYLQKWAARFGLRGLTVYFGKQPPLKTLASKEELVELRTAYETIARREDGSIISQWCHSIRTHTPETEAREHVRGLLLLFERLAERGLSPFTDGRVRFVYPEPIPLDWGKLPVSLRGWLPWLKKFGESSEFELYEYVQVATEEQVRELAALKELMDRDGETLFAWCRANNVEGNPAEDEAFQAEWLYVLVDFAKARIEKLSQLGQPRQ